MLIKVVDLFAGQFVATSVFQLLWFQTIFSMPDNSVNKIILHHKNYSGSLIIG